MVADFRKLADTIIDGTRDKLIQKDIKDNAARIADEIRKHGFYENRDLGFKVSIGTEPARREC